MDPLSEVPGSEIEENDAFIGFVEHARSMLASSLSEEGGDNDGGGGRGDGSDPSWSWVLSRILKTCIAYSSGVTPAILLSDLFQAWSEKHRYATSKKKLECTVSLKKKNKRTRLPNTVTIDSIYEKNFLSQSSILEAFVVDAFLLPGTNIYLLNLGDLWSSYTIDLYLHRRYYHLVDLDHGILKKGREIFLTGCSLRTPIGGSGHPRLLPTEYLVILLDEDQDEDAMLLGAQFCSDSFSSISVDAVKNGSASYSFYARIESIGPLEVQGTSERLQRKQITLVDGDGARLKFLLWGEQIILSNLFSVGSMLALDRPYIENITESNSEPSEELCLEYGSSTQLFLVPFMQHEEQVLPTPTQTKYQGSRNLNATIQSQGPKFSQVSLPQNSEGSIDFSNYPFRLYIIDLHDKMTGTSLYGVITNIEREKINVGNVFSVTIEDRTGAIVAKLHFKSSWSLGRLGFGHTIFISGLTCSLTKKKLLQASWFEKDSGSSLVDLSSLPALLNSSCLHQLSPLSNISSHMNTNVCIVHIDHIELPHVHSMLSHALCGRHVNERSEGLVQCSFCNSSCDGQLVRRFYLRVTLADESAKVFAWCTGQTAAELLQISPDEFSELPEDEQAMYLFTLENERFLAAIVNSNPHKIRSNAASNEANDPNWEITRAQRCE
ncbi:uncharacterized protein A4U43_C02F21940 [Asparagus officinalis]|uniref:Cell division control protein 24 OB domain-containing protein n=1 Tax=Asparagus officinalis TaxID=4686 RepID=A0A5P1FPX0_ASPOF|nr:uncharacterized protein LOC109831885 [Asparagus officinalis]ONK78741.1 uncharacterized protein A4U43_C02F21940 [Asparagus officinalis]